MQVEGNVRINGKVLTWARQRLEVSEPDVAALAGFTEEQIRSWESQAAEPTYSQAVNLSKRLGFPFGYLFLSGVPNRSLPLPDLRTVTGEAPQIPSVALLGVIDDAVRKQNWLSETLQEEGVAKLPFVGSFTLKDAAAKVAADIRSALKLDEQMRAETAPTVAAFMTELVRRSERHGILVLRSGVMLSNTHKALSVSEFRGFALPNPYAPLVFINSRDAMVAQIFTWAHEIAHIWINQSGVSLIDLAKKSKDQANEIESKCNEIAAEVLVPSAGFIHNWNRHISVALNISELRRRYRVSELVVLRKANDLGLITANDFTDGLNRFYEVPLAAKLKKDDSKDSGGNYYNSLYARNSGLFTASVVERFASGSVLVTEACGLLTVRRRVLNKLVAAT